MRRPSHGVKHIGNRMGFHCIMSHLHRDYLSGLLPPFYSDLKGKVKELYAIGDCLGPRSLEPAIYEGFSIGISLLLKQ